MTQEAAPWGKHHVGRHDPIFHPLASSCPSSDAPSWAGLSHVQAEKGREGFLTLRSSTNTEVWMEAWQPLQQLQTNLQPELSLWTTHQLQPCTWG